MPFNNTDSPGMSYALSELGIKGNPNLPVTDSHRIRGGAMTVPTLSDRDSIPDTLRKSNVTKCYVEATDITYVLRGGVLNTNWQPDNNNTAPTVTLEVGAFVGLQAGTAGTAQSINLPNMLFKAQGNRTITIASVLGLPMGLIYTPTTNTITGTPTEWGHFTIVVNGQDSDGNKAQNIFILAVAPAVIVDPGPPVVPPVVPPTTPSVVGSAALNIVMSNTAVCSVILVTPGFAETGAEVFAVADATRRFAGGVDVADSLFLGSSGYTTVPGGIGYYSFAWGVNLFKSRYPSATAAAFDVYVDPINTTPDYINRVNYSAQISSGLQKVTLNNGFDYAYQDAASAVGGFYNYDAGSAVGQQNTVANMHQQFTITGNVKKRIGTMSINLTTGASVFTPIAPGTTVDTRPFCDRGPSITGLTVTSPSALLVDYDGENLVSINWSIEQAGVSVRSGNSGTLVSSHFNIALEVPLPLGDYTLALDGNVCQPSNISGSRRGFTVVFVPVNPAPTVNTAFGNHTITALGDQNLDVPVSTFSDTDSLTWSATLQNGQNLPLGLTFSPNLLRYTASAILPNGTYLLRTIVTDTAGQTAGDNFTLTLNRTTVTGYGEFYIYRLPNTTMVSLYASGTGTLSASILSTGSTPSYAGTKVMLTEGLGYPNPFSSTLLRYGSLFTNVPNGTYTISIGDGLGNVNSYPVTITDSAPVVRLFGTGTINASPVVSAAFGNHTITATGVQTLVIPTGTFADTDALTWSATKQDGTALPSGLTFDPSTHTYSCAANLANGDYLLKTVVTDTAGQTAGDNFTLTLNRAIVDTRPFCDRGPSVTSMALSALGGNVVYDGANLVSINWSIKQNGSVVRAGNSGTLTTSNFNIALSAALPAGDYLLVLDGNTCQPADAAGATRAFTIVAVVEPPTGGDATIGNLQNSGETGGTIYTSQSGSDGGNV